MSNQATNSLSRRLSLHPSALTDSEYRLYTKELRDLTLEIGEPQPPHGENDDNGVQTGDAETTAIGFEDFFRKGKGKPLRMREVRAWLKGRHRKIDGRVVDQVLFLFSDTLAQNETLNYGQLLAVFRLIAHARAKQQPTAALVFVQVAEKHVLNDHQRSERFARAVWPFTTSPVSAVPTHVDAGPSLSNDHLRATSSGRDPEQAGEPRTHGNDSQTNPATSQAQSSSSLDAGTERKRRADEYKSQRHMWQQRYSLIDVEKVRLEEPEVDRAVVDEVATADTDLQPNRSSVATAATEDIQATGVVRRPRSSRCVNCYHANRSCIWPVAGRLKACEACRTLRLRCEKMGYPGSRRGLKGSKN